MSDNSGFETSMDAAMLEIMADVGRNMKTACYVVEAEAKKNLSLIHI